MSTVSFKRSSNVNEIPIVDGQLVFDETHNKIYMDNGTERLQYGGDVSLIEDTSYATSNNTFSANGSLNLFTQKLSVVDNKESALAVTEQHVPVGCLAFQSVVGNADYSNVGNTVSDSLVTLKNNITSVNGQLTANENAIYMDYHDGKYGINTSAERGADTFIPFKSVDSLDSLPLLVSDVSNGTYDVKDAITAAGVDYTTLTADNFVYQMKSVAIWAKVINGSNQTLSATTNLAYNASTGVITITGAYAYQEWDGGAHAFSVTGKGDIRLLA